MKITKIIIYSVFFIDVASIQLPAQQFSPVGQGFNHHVKTLFADTSTNLLYAGGNFLGLSTGEYMGKIAVWNGSNWDSLGSGINTGSVVFSINKYGNDIFVGGSMQTMNGLNHRGLSYWDGLNWNSIGDATYNGYGEVRGVVPINQDLFILGTFDSIGTISANKLAKWDGIAWQSFPVLDGYLGGFSYHTAAIYNNELYVGGNFDGQGSPYLKDIAKFDGTSWVPVGNGFSGFLTSVYDMLVFQGELYIAGGFQVSLGDPANGIVKWDGTNWHQVGLGIEGGIFDMEIYNNELYVCGTIVSVEGNPAGNVAKWNGVQWDNLGGTFNTRVEALTILNGEVYFGGGFTEVNGIPVNYICKYTIPVGIEEIEAPDNSKLHFSPNPTSNFLEISLTFGSINKIEIFNISGKVILEKAGNESLNCQLDVSSLANGIYTIKVITKENSYTEKLLIQK